MSNNWDLQLKCPGCGVEVTEMSLSINYIFVQGVRHVASRTWDLSCCGSHLMDEDLVFDGSIAEDADKVTPVALSDKDGNVVLSWLDQVPDCEDCD